MAFRDPEALHHLSKVVVSGAEAWNTATNTTAPHLQNVLNTFEVLFSSTTPSQPAAPLIPPGKLLELHDGATDSLQRLQTTLRRLRSIITGVNRWLPEVTHEPLVHSAATHFSNALSADLATKAAVIEDVLAVANGVRIMMPDKAEVLLARWTEQTERAMAADGCPSVVVALIESTECMRCVAEGNADTPVRAEKDSVSSPQKNEVSPALAMLKRSTAR